MPGHLEVPSTRARMNTCGINALSLPALEAVHFKKYDPQTKLFRRN